MDILVQQLANPDKPALARHFLALEAEDRRLRFGAGLGDAAIRMYVKDLDLETDAFFGVADDYRRLIGAAHLARNGPNAELGVSVLPRDRARGIGGALLRRAHEHAREWGVRKLFVHCLSENGAMMHLARKEGMDIAEAAGEADAWLRLAPVDPARRAPGAFPGFVR